VVGYSSNRVQLYSFLSFLFRFSNDKPEPGAGGGVWRCALWSWRLDLHLELADGPRPNFCIDSIRVTAAYAAPLMYYYTK
jgi:hypothetical protein